MWKSNLRRVDLHAVDATPARWRGDVGSSPQAIHARMIPLNGTSYDNVFVHFRPSKGWEKFIDVPNGGVVADHVEL